VSPFDPGGQPAPRLDLLIRGATVFPGEGPSVEADVGVRDGLIEAVGSLPDAEAIEVIDGTGAMLAPGFVDLHAHSALAQFDDPLLAPKILQGFTTEVINPDGLAPAPLGRDGVAARREYLRALDGEGPDEWPWASFSEYLDHLDATHPGPDARAVDRARLGPRSRSRQ